jgi:hypothetical protein
MDTTQTTDRTYIAENGAAYIIHTWAGVVNRFTGKMTPTSYRVDVADENGEVAPRSCVGMFTSESGAERAAEAHAAGTLETI